MLRDIKVYHYGTRGTEAFSPVPSIIRPEIASSKLVINDDEAIDLKRDGSYFSPVELNPPEATEYFRAMTNLFSSREKLKWNVGPGLYAAVDPIQSESYAGRPWFMLEVTIPKGSKYLDLRPFDGIVVSKKFVSDWLSQIKLGEYRRGFKRTGANQFILSWRDLLEKPNFRKLVIQAIQKLNIDEFAYAWNEGTIKPCLDRSMEVEIAFNFVNPALLDRGGKLKLYTQNLEKDAPAEKKAAYKELIEKIEMSEIHGSYQVYKDPNQQNSASWSNSNLEQTMRIRLYTLGWTQILGHESLVRKWVSQGDNFDRQYDFYVNRNCPPQTSTNTAYYNGQSACVGIPFEFNRNFVTFVDKEDTYNPGQNYLYRHYYFDPTAKLKETDPTEYKRRMNIIERDTFGCSAKPELEVENIPPSL